MAVPAVTERTHLEEARALLLGEFQNKPKIEAFLDALVTQASDAEAAALQALAVRNGDLENTVGDGLDKWGKLVGADRLGRSDADYRIAIAVQDLVNRSSGRGDDILNIVALLVPLSSLRRFKDLPPASFRLTLSELPAATVAELLIALGKARLACVDGALVHTPSEGEEVFLWDTITPSITTNGWATLPHPETNGAALAHLSTF